ncbi:hypothetical protein [Nonomuraea sp. NPDC052265]|uniref:hypothetical protein n=1 Tax=Nonomuraea sp. NPDC052265 TaxID=3364374 RepID=UPI0037CA65C1
MTCLLGLGGVFVAVLLGWTATAHATGERLVDDYRAGARANLAGASSCTLLRPQDDS